MANDIVTLNTALLCDFKENTHSETVPNLNDNTNSILIAFYDSSIYSSSKVIESFSFRFSINNDILRNVNINELKLSLHGHIKETPPTNLITLSTKSCLTHCCSNHYKMWKTRYSNVSTKSDSLLQKYDYFVVNLCENNSVKITSKHFNLII